MKKLYRKYCLLINDVRDPLIFPFSLTSTIEKCTFPSHVVTSVELSSTPVRIKTLSIPDTTTVNSCNTDVVLTEGHLIHSLCLH